MTIVTAIRKRRDGVDFLKEKKYFNPLAQLNQKREGKI